MPQQLVVRFLVLGNLEALDHLKQAHGWLMRLAVCWLWVRVTSYHSRFGWEMKRGKFPAQSTSAAVTDNWRCSCPRFLFSDMRQTLVLFLLSSFWCTKKQQENALSHVHTLARVTLYTHSPAFIGASSHPEMRWNRMSLTREKKSKEAHLAGLLQDPSTTVFPCLVQGQQAPVQAVDACMMGLLPPCFVHARRRQW